MATPLRSPVKNIVNYSDSTSAVNIDYSVMDTDPKHPVTISQIVGSDFDDIIKGNNSANQELWGGAGDDRLITKGSYTSFNGGEGNDTADFSTRSDAVYADLSSGHTQSGDRFVSIENLIGGSGNNTLIGNDGVNRLVGGTDGDLLDGGHGADIMIGGNGSDTYVVDNVGDTVVELAGQGTDRVISTLSDYTLGANLENLELRDAAISGTGNDTANLMLGNDRDNFLFGLGGNDTLRGNAGNDHLDGGAGNDVLAGGAGQDWLTGGVGKDTFQFLSSSESNVVAPDHITDFTHGSDKVDLSRIDAKSVTASNDAFAFIGSADFSHTAGQVRFEAHAGYTLVQGDTNGDGVADFAISLDGYHTTMTASDFTL